MPRFARLRCVCAAAALAAAPVLPAQTPTTGTEVLQRMHDAYAGTWFRTLRFVQKTTQFRPNGTKVIATWYESLRYTPAATQLRIDLGDPALGNGVLYTADSSWRVTKGALASASGDGNVVLPLIEGVYLQPVARTIAELHGTNVDMSRISQGAWEGRPVWVIGAASASDTTSPQLWIDQQRNVVVRAIVGFSPTSPAFDIHLDDYVPVGGGWLATKVVMSQGGAPRQIEDYADWKADIDLPASLFALATWVSAPHWAAR